jgi:DNA-binding transcriptional MerR regulator
MSQPHPRRLAIVPDLPSVLVSDELGGVEADGVLQVGELARVTGKTVRALHLYESMGLLRPVERSRGRFRLFNADSVERVRWIGKLQKVGFSLPELVDIVKLQEAAPTAKDAAARVRAVYLEKLTAVQSKLAELHRLEHELVASMKYLDACQTACEAAAPTAACPSCGRHLDQPTQPALVAGLHVS